MRIHVIAVAGTGMGALAGLLKELGHEVSGSDVSFDPPMGPALEAWGIRLSRGFDPAHLDHQPDLVVVGQRTRARQFRPQHRFRPDADDGSRENRLAGRTSGRGDLV